MKQKIPVLDLKDEIALLEPQILSAIREVLHSTQFILGPKVEAFEREVASFLGVPFTIGVNSGTDALTIALRSAGIGPGDEVIVPAFTFFATAEAVHSVGGVVHFVDIEEDSFNLSIPEVEKAITPRTRAIIPVHLFGQPAEMEPLLELARTYKLKVIEDVAQAFGAEYHGKKVGTLGDAGAFSFFPSKNLGAYGDGGMIATSNPEIAEKARMLRAHGSKKKYYNEMIGYNSRLDEIQSAILLVKFKYLEEWNRARFHIALRYNSAFASHPDLTPPQILPRRTHVFHQYTLRVLKGKRDPLKKKLEEKGVSTMIYYPVPLHRLPLYGDQYPPGSFPVSERLAGEVLSLPIWPQMKEEVQEYVIRAVIESLEEIP
jgi:dTDP-4-amino-4,6-dideoxygalactose transaminase